MSTTNQSSTNFCCYLLLSLIHVFSCCMVIIQCFTLIPKRNIHAYTRHFSLYLSVRIYIWMVLMQRLNCFGVLFRVCWFLLNVLFSVFLSPLSFSLSPLRCSIGFICIELYVCVLCVRCVCVCVSVAYFVCDSIDLPGCFFVVVSFVRCFYFLLFAYCVSFQYTLAMFVVRYRRFFVMRIRLKGMVLLVSPDCVYVEYECLCIISTINIVETLRVRWCDVSARAHLYVQWSKKVAVHKSLSRQLHKLNSETFDSKTIRCNDKVLRIFRPLKFNRYP